MSITTSSNSKKSLLFLLVIVLLSRLLLAYAIWRINGPSGFYRNDTVTYVGPAESLLRGSFLSSGGYSVPGTPEIFRTPGYPLLLFPAVAFHHIVLIALLENCLLATISAWLIWRMVIQILPGTNAALWAVLFYCFEPLGFLLSETLLSETFFTTIFLLFVWLLLRFFREPSYGKFALSAVVLGCATYIRPAPLYLALWLIPLFLAFPRSLSWRRRLSLAVLFPLIFTLTLAPWVVRNTVEADYKAFSSSQDWNLYFMAAAAVQAKLEHRNSAQLMEEWGATTSIEDYFRAHPEQRTWSEARIARFWHIEAKRIISSNLAIYGVLHARGCLRVIFNPGISEVLKGAGLLQDSNDLLSIKLGEGLVPAKRWLLQQYPLVAILVPLMIVQLFFYYALAVLGLRRMLPEMRFLFAGLFLYFVLVSGFPAAMARYRAPIMPLVCVLAGISTAFWMTKKTREGDHGGGYRLSSSEWARTAVPSHDTSTRSYVIDAQHKTT